MSTAAHSFQMPSDINPVFDIDQAFSAFSSDADGNQYQMTSMPPAYAAGSLNQMAGMPPAYATGSQNQMTGMPAYNAAASVSAGSGAQHASYPFTFSSGAMMTNSIPTPNQHD